MAGPEWDRSTGRWYIRYHVPGPDGPERVKKTIPKHDGWKKLKDRPRSVPPQVLLWARPRFQDIDASTKLGHDVKVPRSTPIADFLRAYESSYALSRKANSLKGLKNSIRRFLEYSGRVGLSGVEAVGVGDLPPVHGIAQAIGPRLQHDQGGSRAPGRCLESRGQGEAGRLQPLEGGRCAGGATERTWDARLGPSECGGDPRLLGRMGRGTSSSGGDQLRASDAKAIRKMR